jgi:putative peptidoglycan binding protein
VRRIHSSIDTSPIEEKLTKGGTMTRVLFEPGACGFLVLKIQQTLTSLGFDPKGTDGIYGNDTSAAVESFQNSMTQLQTEPHGLVTEATWTSLVKEPVPSTEEKALQLTSSFEGHGFTLASGNWDDAWLTWGIIGFTMKYGQVQKILQRVNASSPHCLTDAFGDRAGELVRLMNAPATEQEMWANSITLGTRLAEPWRSGFVWLGQFPEVQREQLRLAHEDYYVPACATASRYGFKTELGLALAFDIQVQNGGIGRTAKKLIQERIAQNPPADERALRIVIANSVAAAAKPRFREDVLQRKLAIATGEGRVHGHNYVLSKWGLIEAQAGTLFQAVAA